MADVLCPAGPLEDFIGQICLKVGAGQKAADEVAHHLVRANLSGHDSHGVLRMRWYVDQVDRGQLKPDAESGVARFLADRGRATMHHMCFEVRDLRGTLDRLL